MVRRHCHRTAMGDNAFGAVFQAFFAFAMFVFTTTSNAQLSQGINSLTYYASQTSGDTDNSVSVEFSTMRSRIKNETTLLPMNRLIESGFGLSGLSSRNGSAYLSIIDNDEYEATTGIWFDRPPTDQWVYGGILTIHPDPPSGMPYPTPEELDWQSGYLIRQSGSTWYGDLAMDTGTTFSADNLIANAIRTTSLQSTSISASSISTSSLQASSIRSNSLTTGVLTVTGNASIGGNLNMNNNRITNVGDGVEQTDAINMRQLQRTETHISDLRKESRGGIASVAALVGIPVTPVGSDGALGVAVGSYKGESSLAISGSRQVNDKATIKLGISTPSGNNGVVGSFGVGIRW